MLDVVSIWCTNEYLLPRAMVSEYYEQLKVINETGICPSSSGVGNDERGRTREHSGNPMDELPNDLLL